MTKLPEDTSVYSARVDSLELPPPVIEKLLGHSVRTVRRLKSLTAEKMKKIGLSDKEVKLIEVELERLFTEKQLLKISFVVTECPKCGSQLTKRKGKFGEFMGCPMYPKCNYARSTA